MLKNERYIGRSVWKKRTWVTDPATGARTYRMRGEDEWVTTEQPQLAIFAKDLWDRAQARFADRKGAKGRARGTGTGLLRCGECGATMRVVSLERKAGRAYADFGCSAHHGKGAAICGNGLVISERRLNRAVIDELRKLLASKEIQARFVDGFTKRLQHRNPSDDRERAAIEAEVTAQEARVRNLTAAIARSGFSEALAEQLGLEEETLRSLRQRLAAKVPVGERSDALPDPDAVARFLEKVLEIAETAPKRASVPLSRILVPITLVPVKDPDGTRRYEARGALNTNPAVLSDGRAGSANDGCGGPDGPFIYGFKPLVSWADPEALGGPTALAVISPRGSISGAGRQRPRVIAENRYVVAEVLARIERRRKEVGLSRRKLAALIGVKEDAAYRKFQGRAPFFIEELGRIAEALDAPAGWPFIDEEDGELLEAVKKVIVAQKR